MKKAKIWMLLPGETATPPPKVPSFSIRAILRLRTQLFRALESEFVGVDLRGDALEHFLDAVAEQLPQTIRADVLQDSLRHLASHPLTSDALYQACWRLAGNVRRLRLRRAVPPWRVQKIREWVPVQIMRVQPRRRGRRVGAFCTLRILAGTPCPLVIQHWWSFGQCRVLAQDLGFSRPAGPKALVIPRYPYSAPPQLVGLRLLVLLDPALSDEEPDFGSHLAFPPGLHAYNSELLRCRFRVDEGYSCPRNYAREFVCHQCPVGYQECRAATHRLNWERRACTGCQRPDALFDDDLSEALCVDCAAKAAYKR